MKLFEEFKEYEHLWEAAPPTNVHAPFEWTIGDKTYNIIDDTELRAYLKDAVQNELTTNAAKYANDFGDDKTFMAYYNVFTELITYYENHEPVNKAFINRLNVLSDRYLSDLHSSYDKKNLQQDIAIIADACLSQFTAEMEKLSPNFKRNILEPGRQSDLDTIKEELIRLGMVLAHSNSIIN